MRSLLGRLSNCCQHTCSEKSPEHMQSMALHSMLEHTHSLSHTLTHTHLYNKIGYLGLVKAPFTVLAVMTGFLHALLEPPFSRSPWCLHLTAPFVTLNLVAVCLFSDFAVIAPSALCGCCPASSSEIAVGVHLLQVLKPLKS